MILLACAMCFACGYFTGTTVFKLIAENRITRIMKDLEEMYDVKILKEKQ